MTGRILQRYTGHADAVSDDGGPIPGDAESTDDLGAFGWLRGVRERAIMLELRKKCGAITAIGYAWIEKVEFEPSEGITLHMLGQRIRIKGRNLNTEVRPLVRLFDGIVRQKVPYIQEADQPSGLWADEAATVIETIEL